MKKENKNSKIEEKLKKGFRIYTLLFIGISIMTILIPNVFAAEDDPITVINNLSDFIFQITKLIGGIIAGYGIVQFGLSFTSHDSSQRVNGILFCVGGVIVMCSKVILNIIGG